MPGPMKSMKLTKQDKEPMEESIAVKSPEYPYGLNIRLENESISKLGMKELPEIGKKMLVLAKVEVSSASQRSVKNGKDMKSIELQITDMSIGPKEKYKNASETLYDKEK